MDQREENYEYDRYYEPSKKTVLVPVEVTYHDATDAVFTFKSPTLSDIEEATKDDYSGALDKLKEEIIEADKALGFVGSYRYLGDAIRLVKEDYEKEIAALRQQLDDKEQKIELFYRAYANARILKSKTKER